MSNILVIDDEERMALLVASTLEDAGYSVTSETNSSTAAELISQRGFDLVITDLRMEPLDGIGILEKVKSVQPECGVILMTAYASAESAVTAMKQGAYDYIIKPFSLDELVMLVKRFLKSRRTESLNEQLKSDYEKVAFGKFVGKSAGVQELFDLVEKVAKRESTVLLLGESGTGKELVANLIHQRSPRVDGTFIALNCAALTETLLESELFGHEKGAFTGAVKRKPGRFELAAGGTLFLDEIGEISPAMQAKLLRVLELGQFVRVGGTEQLHSDARIVAATNRNLKQEMEKGNFREDLYFRLSVFPIEVPPLRNRKDDIADLTNHFLERLGYAHGKLPADCQRLLEAYPFPGNVRELKNLVERAIILADGEAISSDLLGINVEEETTPDLDAGLIESERRMIVDALNKSGGNKTRAAEILKITRRRLYSRMKIYEIKSGPDRTFE